MPNREIVDDEKAGTEIGAGGEKESGKNSTVIEVVCEQMDENARKRLPCHPTVTAMNEHDRNKRKRD